MILPSPHVPWTTAFQVALPHGLVAGVHLPGVGEPVPREALARLHPEERAFATELRGFRQEEFVGGRLALSTLFGEIGLKRTAVLVDAHGAPDLPPGVCGSIAHKRHLAVALLARGGPGLGVDLEDTAPERPGVMARVLRAEELEAVKALPPERQWTDAVLRFALKEAVYKAIHPFVRRYVGFGEVAVWPSPDGVDRVQPFLAHGEGPFRFEARHTWIGTQVLALVRVRAEGFPPPRGALDPGAP